ncbi:MAG: hypothetical protein JW760_12490 [Spirochaetales bacterium]|nr:hypothetical protein [Spirochaetales bacterium]
MTEKPIPDLFIEQLVLNELPKKNMDRISSKTGLSKTIDALKESNEEILSMYPPEMVVPLIRQRAAKPAVKESTAKSGKLIAFLPLAAALAVLLLVLPQVFKKDSADTGPVSELTRIKGAVPTLSIYKQIRGGSERLINGSEISPRDLLQIGYIPAGKRFGAIISIDGRGQVTLHFPEHINDPKDLTSGGETLLPFAYELDDAPAFERFYFVASDKDFSLSSIILSAESVAASRDGLSMERLPLPESFNQDSIVLIKE